MNKLTQDQVREEIASGEHVHEGGGWWEYDARGIELAKVCEVCVKVVLAKYTRDCRTNPGYDVDEAIEPEETAPTEGGAA